MKAAGRDFLDTLTCASPGCQHDKHDGMFLHSRCHTTSGAEVEYKGGVLFVRCQKCKKPIVNVKVAEMGDAT